MNKDDLNLFLESIGFAIAALGGVIIAIICIFIIGFILMSFIAWVAGVPIPM